MGSRIEDGKKNIYCRILASLVVLISLWGCALAASFVPTKNEPTDLPVTIQLEPTATTSILPTATDLPATPTVLQLATKNPPTSTYEPGHLIYQHPQKYQVEYIVTLRNNGGTFDRVLVYQPKPVTWDAQQGINILEVSPKPSKETIEKENGNGIYYWQILNGPKEGEELPIIIRFSFTAFETIAEIDPADIRPYHKDDPLYKLYTRPEPYIESDDQAIIDLAQKIGAGETNPYILARRFYDYIVRTAEYALLGRGLLGAKVMVTTNKGECGDFSALFIALSRASGIPARAVVGYWALTGTDQAHVWAEFYLEGIGWVPVDPTIAQSQVAMRDYYFGNMDNRRVILNKGFNIKLSPPAPDTNPVPFLQVPFWWYWGDGVSESTVSLDHTDWNIKILLH